MKERVTKVLGFIWNTNTDEFSISTKKLENIEETKKRKKFWLLWLQFLILLA